MQERERLESRCEELRGRLADLERSDPGKHRKPIHAVALEAVRQELSRVGTVLLRHSAA